ncbi:MAG: caspase family protein [Bacteroidales bacterium]|nr:caspase family protein [Bacteroidales bacterium]
MKNLIILLFLIPLIISAQKPELVIKSGVQGEAMMVSVSPDNKLGLTVDDKMELMLWELRSGKQLKSITNILAADFGLDNKSIDVVTGDYKFRTIDYFGNTIKEGPVTKTTPSNKLTYSYYRKSGLYLENGIINTRDKGFLCRIVPEHYDIVQHYSEKLNLLAIAYESEVELCKVPTGEIFKVIKFDLAQQNADYPSIVFTQFSPDGKYLMAGNNLSLEIIEIETGKSVYTYSYPPDKLKQDLWDNSNLRFLNIAGFSPDSKKLLILTSQEQLMVNLATKKEVWKQPQTEIICPVSYASRRGLVRFSDDGSKVLVGYYNVFQFLNVENGTVISRLKGITQAYMTYHQLLENVNGLFIEQDNKIINWNLASGAVETTTSMDSPYTKYHIQINKKGTKFYKNQQEVDRETKTSIDFEDKQQVGYDDSKLLSISYDNKYLLHIVEDKSIDPYDRNAPVNEYNLVVLDVETKKILWKKKEIDAAVFSNTSNAIAVANTRIVKDQWGYNTIQLLDGSDGSLIKSFTIPANSQVAAGMVFSSRDTYLTLDPYEFNGQHLSYDCQLLIDLASGTVKQISKILPNGNHFRFRTFTDDEKYLVVTDQSSSDGDVYFYDIMLQKWDLSKSIKLNEKNNIRAVTVTKNNRFMFTNTQEFKVKLWDLEAKKLAATLYPVPATGDWAVVMPDGRFDASPEAQKDIYFVKGLNTFPLEILFEQFYTPRLLPRLLAGERFSPIDADFDNLKKAPVVKISYEQKTRNLLVEDEGMPAYTNTTGLAQITVNAKAENDKIDEIRLFHNGKIVNLATRGLFVTDDVTNTESKKYTISLMPGVNTFRAIALNSQRTESKADEIQVKYQPVGKPEGTLPVPKVGNGIIDEVDKNATLFLIVVGINKYQNEKMSLNYALADATAFKEELEKDTKTVLSNIKTWFVTDNAANKQGILGAFSEVQKIAKPQDVFVFYYAGHGLIGKDKEFYLIPNDVSDLKNVQTELTIKAIPAKLLQKYAVDILAQKQLFILDACQSAGAFESMLSNDGDQQKSIAVVARSTGTHWMAASGAQQFANEFSQLGHGAFTYVLLEALKGSAAADKMITVNGLKSYLQKGVPELMKKYSGTLQYPASYGFGNDFPVEIVK